MSGASVTDTIDARPTQLLVVEVRDSSGRVAAERTVRFSVLSEGDSRLRMGVSGAAAGPYFGFVPLLTDRSGRASVFLSFGTVPGPARLAVSVPELGVADTADYLVTVGAPSRVVVAPADTVVAPGSAYSLSATLVDRHGNSAVGEAPAFSAGPGITSVSSAGVVTVGTAVMRTEIVLTWRTTSLAARVSIVPRLPLVTKRSSPQGSFTALVNTDLTDSALVTRHFDSYDEPHMVAGSPFIVYYQLHPEVDASVWIVTRGSSPKTLAGAANGFRVAAHPRLSPDGGWVYFVGTRGQGARSLWRIRPDGTQLDSLTTINRPRGIESQRPSISPDGRVVVVDHYRQLRVFDTATREARTIDIDCGAPRHSPDGARFACVREGQLSVMNVDGSAARSLTPAVPYALPFNDLGADWSPDGRWLVAHYWTEGLVLVDSENATRILLFRPLGLSDTQASFVR